MTLYNVASIHWFMYLVASIHWFIVPRGVHSLVYSHDVCLPACFERVKEAAA